MAAEASLKAKGVDEVLIFTVNDGAVVSFWREYLTGGNFSGPKAADDIKKGLNVDKNAFVKFAGDPKGELAKACGMEMTHEGPVTVLGHNRSKRWACIVENGKVTWFDVSEGPTDPAGDGDPSKTMPDAVLKNL